LLLGQTIDSNAAYIATQLSRAGIDVHRKQTVGDNLERIVDCIQGALSRADALIITGGLGPTTDDLTREAIAASLNLTLDYHPELEQDLRDFFARRGITPSETIMRQAYLPDGAEAIPNPVGTAPGVCIRIAHKMIFAVPGVPREMRAMIDQTVVPTLLEHTGGERSIIVSRTLRTTGIGESSLAEPIEDILTTASNPTIAPLLYQDSEVHLRMTAKTPDEATANALLDELEARVRERVGEHIFGVDNESLPAVVGREMIDLGLTLGVAESLTGGLINSLLTDAPNASKTLLCGVVAYSPVIKHEVLGVSQRLIDEEGVVNAETAAAMAEGIRNLAAASIGVSTTGEAGPESASGAPVGTVFIGLCDGEGTHTFQRHFSGDRDVVKKRAAMAALDILRRHLMTQRPQPTDNRRLDDNGG
jgi:nicotinamide-nucleotide amidase